MRNVFTVRNAQQKAIFDHEIKGQLSDGLWESTRPLLHWESWCAADVVVAKPGESVGRNWVPIRDNYDLTSKALLDAAARRMIVAVKIVSIFGDDLYGLMSRLYDIEGVWQGPPTDRGEYEDRIRRRIAAVAPDDLSLDQLRQLIEQHPYNEKDLKRDLKELKAAMRVYYWKEGEI